MTKFIPALLAVLAFGAPTMAQCCKDKAKAEPVKTAKAKDGCCGDEAKTAKATKNVDDGCSGGVCGDAPKGKVPAGIKTAKTCGKAKDKKACGDKAKSDCGSKGKVANKDGKAFPNFKDGCGDKAKKSCGDAKTAKQGCDKSKQVALSVKFAKLQAGAKKGCNKSAKMLAALKVAAKTNCEKTIAAKLATLESNAAKGCGASKKELARLSMAASYKPAKLSERVARWTKNAKKGCKTSAALMAAVKSNCETGCEDAAAKKIAQLEANAAKGCKKSSAKLASMEASVKKAIAKRMATKKAAATKKAPASSKK